MKEQFGEQRVKGCSLRQDEAVWVQPRVLGNFLVSVNNLNPCYEIAVLFNTSIHSYPSEDFPTGLATLLENVTAQTKMSLAVDEQYLN